MANIHIIAWPPGAGKSTSGEDFIDPELDILNEDEMRFKYKGKGYVDYKEYLLAWGCRYGLFGIGKDI